MSTDPSETQSSKTFALNEEEILVSLIECQVDGNLETGNRFYGRLIAFNARLLLLEGTKGQRLLIKRKMVARLEAV